MSEPSVTTYLVPVGQPIGANLLYVSEVTVQAGSNDVSVILHDVLPVAGLGGVDPDLRVRRPIAIVKMSPQTLKGMAQAFTEAVAVYEREYGKLTVADVGREGE